MALNIILAVVLIDIIFYRWENRRLQRKLNALAADSLQKGDHGLAELRNLAAKDRIAAMKELREATGADLKTAKKLIDSLA